MNVQKNYVLVMYVCWTRRSGNKPVKMAWSTLSVVEKILMMRISAGTLSPTVTMQDIQ